MNVKMMLTAALSVAWSALLVGCATESSQVVESSQVRAAATAHTYQGEKQRLIVGSFYNRSDYQNGIFSSGSDRLGSQAKTILQTHLQQTGRFIVMDRDNMAQIAEEAGLSGTQSAIQGANVIVTGDVTEFGRKVVGDRQLFGILGSGKKQVAYAKVMLNVVDVNSSAILYSSQGAGEFELSSREVLGTGGTASYDSTLNGKVLNLAISEAVDNLIVALEQKKWSAE